MSMQEIEKEARAYAEARTLLAERVGDLQVEIDAAKRRRLRGIRGAVATAAAAHDRLRALVAANPDLFAKPRTRTLHGIRCGWMKRRGELVIDDVRGVIARIHKLLPDQAELLVRTVESVNKAAVYELSVADCKRLGITITDDTDEVIVKPVGEDVDKIVDALLVGIEADAVALE